MLFGYPRGGADLQAAGWVYSVNSERIGSVVHIFTNEVEDGKYSIRGVTIVTDEGRQVCIGGGEKSHIGSVAISQPRDSLKEDGGRSYTTSDIYLIGHKDHAISISVAETICKSIDSVVVVSAGDHINRASAQEIKRVLGNIHTLQESMGKKIKSFGL